MRKLAFFVEGLTEQVFIKKLFLEIANKNALHIETGRFDEGGRSGRPRRLTQFSVAKPGIGIEYFVLIYDCSGYERITSDIRDRYDGLVGEGFSLIIAVQDVRPRALSDVPEIRRFFRELVRQDPIESLLILAVMEIEAWFIAECSHFAQCHPSLTLDMVIASLGYDPCTHDLQSVNEPCEDLRRAYTLAGSGYNKSRAHVQATVEALDFATVYLDLPTRFPDFASLIVSIEGFLS